MKARSQREFFDALITEVGFPAVDGSSKDSGYLTLTIRPKSVRFKVGDGKVLAVPKAVKPIDGFALSLPGIDTTHLQRIDPLSIKATDARAPGEITDAPNKLESKAFKITLSEEYSESFHAWFQDFVVNGNNDDSKHKTGTLTYYDVSHQPLLVVNLQGVGIFQSSHTTSDRPKSEVGLYTGKLSVKFLPTTTEGADAGR